MVKEYLKSTEIVLLTICQRWSVGRRPVVGGRLHPRYVILLQHRLFQLVSECVRDKTCAIAYILAALSCGSPCSSKPDVI